MSTNNYCSDTMRITRLTIIKWLQQVISDVSSVLAQNMAPMRHRMLSDHCLLGFLVQLHNYTWYSYVRSAYERIE